MKNSNSYISILKSTSVIGSAQIIKIIFNIIRSKILAILIGPSGIGLIGTYSSITGLVQQISGLGIGTSAVREIAQAHSKQDTRIISNSIITLRRITILLGIIGMITAIVLSKQLSQLTFKNNEYAFEISLLSIIILFNIISGSQSALIQGVRKIKDLSRLTVLGAVYGTVFSIPIVYFLKLDGIIPYLIIVALAQLITSWWYARKIPIKKIQLSLKQILRNSQEMIKLGFAFMLGGLTNAAGIYIIKILLIRTINIESVGLYQAAIALSSKYISFILDAMGKDFYPRLTAVSNDSSKCTKLINEQTEIGILLAAPGLLFTLALAPFLIRLFYSSEFLISYQILRWMILGVFFRSISWPMGYLFIAKGKGKVFFYTQLLFNVIHTLLILLFIQFYGIIGTGIALFVAFIFHVFVMKLLISKEINFHWNRKLIQLILTIALIFMIAFIILNYTSQLYGSIIVILMGIALTIFTLHRIMAIIQIKSLKQLIHKVRGKLNKQTQQRKQ